MTRKKVYKIEENPGYNANSSVLVIGGPLDIFERGAWFSRHEFAETLLYAYWEQGMVVKLCTSDKLSRCFIVCGETAAADMPEDEQPESQWLEEVRLIDGAWVRIDDGMIIRPESTRLGNSRGWIKLKEVKS